ncbi:chromate efflux transporter [Paracoccus sp. SSK6]|uniref:chromate efflux transporter n=1 Tax=Paracoccus sp. SSK6 TaxID=3143131 RepID=UPI00321A5009
MQGNLIDIAAAFTKLGLTSFGGPIAHLGYFRDELVLRRKWIDDAGFAGIVAVAQFLPGPASSQAGFALGWQRGGLAGALVAMTCFTLPSAVAMVLLAAMAGTVPPETGFVGGLVAGLKITAVAVVAHAVLGMARSLAPDGPRAGIALSALLALSLLPLSAVAQVAVIAAGGLAGLVLRVGQPGAGGQALRGPSRAAGVACLAVFAVLLAGLPLLADAGPGWRLADLFYRAGALVFGGGHVVLPLLAAGTKGIVPEASVLAGYGAAQAMPGPLFTFAGWLGQVAAGLPGALIGLAMIFLPGFLLMAGGLPFWATLSRKQWARHGMAGANAAVVGILAQALYDPVFTGGIRGNADFAVAGVLFVMLAAWQRPAWQVVLAGAAAGMALVLV